ncbi:hypothetical protein DSAG12_03531 [Promethearchaeum syntrophicum]|uniref:Uncharacterized protein n=1 Tax=Promethearchaeum syntrophicum TaxID=2594042 RepID=A0A5B9DFY6_9ARCH|nr:hypothetical protein [Candidatus Prometheoarchaeum syntrophicum]
MVKKIPHVREEISTLVLVGLAIITFFLAFLHTLTPIYMLLILAIHILIIKLTIFNERNPNPLLHFNRNFEGTVLLSMFIVSGSYFLSWIIGGFDLDAVYLAEITVIFSYLMFIYVIFAGITPFGIYFAIRIVYFWFPYFLDIDGNILENGAQLNLPITMYIEVIIISLLCLGTWFTFVKFIYNSLSGKESYGKQTQIYKKIGTWYGIITLFLGLLLIYIEILISNYVIRGLTI